MVAGWQRLNEKRSQPNPNIVFIKPLNGPDEKIAQDFLERIAAQCRPIMRENHLYVTSLEEYEPNREFVGRNFNAGEVVQLVLKSPSTGRWLPFEYVQMVMMHELAHCKQMNHSRAFWAVRNGYAAEMQTLWSKGYTGDGIWGRGAKLATGEWERHTVLADEVLPEHLCGGTYRSRGSKRKKKPALSYKEQKERRILKKFGKNGVALGADDDTKVKLEKGKKVQAKPRVAGSARGRELRAAAALARFDKPKGEPERIKDEDEETESGSDSEYEVVEVDGVDAVDVDGKRLVDRKGRGMIKVCEDEDQQDPGARDEADELRGWFTRGIKRESPELQGLGTLGATGSRSKARTPGQDGKALETRRSGIKEEPNDGPSRIDAPARSITIYSSPRPQVLDTSSTKRSSDPETFPPRTATTASSSFRPNETSTTKSCSMCSFGNPLASVTCTICANVLEPTSNSWRCNNNSCKQSLYRNSGDCGVCGLCGRRRGDGD
ncbi:Fc.00g066810.m01.CDS01 [Cosmosporella sp. VM-42]